MKERDSFHDAHEAHEERERYLKETYPYSVTLPKSNVLDKYGFFVPEAREMRERLFGKGWSIEHDLESDVITLHVKDEEGLFEFKLRWG